jgi:GT2 family glycosyltransferase
MCEARDKMTSNPPRIEPLQWKGPRPLWSVMIPTYNPRREYLEQAIKSVLDQGYGPEEMEIVVVDDCSPDTDVAPLVESIAGGRVAFQMNKSNLGLARCWNSCIERSRGEWVHILHQDDYVALGFYRRLQDAAASYPEVGLLATRSFFVDEGGAISGVTRRVLPLENGGNAIEEFFYTIPFQCPGVVVRRTSYEKTGGFRLDLKYTLDWEMWARVVASQGGLVTSDALAFYRRGALSETQRLQRNGETVRDHMRLEAIWLERFKGFRPAIFRREVASMALWQACTFRALGDRAAERISLALWREIAPMEIRLGGELSRFRILFGAWRRSFWKANRHSRQGAGNQNTRSARSSR